MAELRELGEFGFIDVIAEMVGKPPEQVLTGIGDDCAVIDTGGADKLLVTTDAALEGRHFSLDWMTPFEAAQRSVAGAVSDIAAMGGRPFAMFCTCGLPPSTDVELATELLRGVAETGRRYGAPLVGGDTISAPDSILIDLTVLGWAAHPWLRSGAMPGDALLVTGTVGESRSALEALLRDKALLDKERFEGLRVKMVDPTPRVAEAALLAPTGLIHAAIDISDGLYQDAGHIARSSSVAIEIDAPRLPVTDATREASTQLGGDALYWGLTSGEEYELLLAVDPADVAQLQALVDGHGLAPLTQIGRAVTGEGVVLVRADGSRIEMAASGWDHFRATS